MKAMKWGVIAGLFLGIHTPASQAQQATAPCRIVATTGMVADIVRHVGGDRAQVVNLMGEGIDPHLYKPTRHDVIQLLQADVVFYSGLLLEGRMTDTFVKISKRNPHVYAVTEQIDKPYLLEPQGFHGHADPHVWMDVNAWSQCVAAVAEGLTRYDPAHGPTYHQNALAYQTQLTQLDAYVRQAIASIPSDQRVLITAHDAFNYFGRAYNIKVMGIQGISTASEAGLEDINRLVDFLVDRHIRSIFIESSVSQKNITALIEGAKSRGHEVKIGGQLFSDAMGEPGTYLGTYVGMLDHNATIIARALGGHVPQGGLHGQLTPDP